LYYIKYEFLKLKKFFLLKLHFNLFNFVIDFLTLNLIANNIKSLSTDNKDYSNDSINNKNFDESGYSIKLRNKALLEDTSVSSLNYRNRETTINSTKEKSINKNLTYIDDKYRKIVSSECNLNILKLKKKISTNSVKLLFSKKYLTTSLRLLVIWFANSFVSFGLLYSLPRLFDKNSNNKQDSMKQLIKTMLFVLPSSILKGYISDLKFLGRRNTLALAVLIASINAIICFSVNSYLYLFTGLLKFSVQITIVILSIYTCEVYPTEIRSFALGFGMSINKFGGFLSSFGCELFDIFIPKGSFLMFGIICFISFLFTVGLKYETVGKPLDCDDSEDDENLSKIKYIKDILNFFEV